MKTIKTLALVLVIVGGLNWGAVGLLGTDLVVSLLGSWPTAVTVVYDLVGLSALLMIFSRPRMG